MHLPVMNPNCTFGESSATLGLAAALQSPVTQCIAPNGNHLITSALTQNKVAKTRSKRKQMFQIYNQQVIYNIKCYKHCLKTLCNSQ